MVLLNIIKNSKKFINNIKYTKLLNLKTKLSTSIVNNIVCKVKDFDWNKNKDLIKLRQKGYTPFLQLKNPNFKPKPMRNKIRKEMRDTLTKLSIILIDNCDFFINDKYLFEVLLPFKNIANLMNMVKTYKNGKYAYNAPLHALYVLEQLNYIIVYRDKDYILKKYKPLRIWLTSKFFNIFGIKTTTLSFWLFLFKKWIIKNNLLDFYTNKYLIHSNKINNIKINIDNNTIIKDKLISIKNNINKYYYVFKNDFFLKEIKPIINNNNENKHKIIKQKIINNNIKEIKINFNNISYEKKYFEYTTSNLFTVPEILFFERKMLKYCTNRVMYSEKWYKFLFYSIKKYKINENVNSNIFDKLIRILRE